MKVKVIGAGSIGNHLAQASRRMGWEVTVVDRDAEALRRMKEEIYPKRYGAWDESIQLVTSDQEPCGGFDLIFIGTPPDVRMKLALRALAEKPKILQLEKPLCTPSLEGLREFLAAYRSQKETVAVIGYDHAVSDAITEMLSLLNQKAVGKVETVDVEFREHWKGIFSAHPWLKGPRDTYLGFWRRGGGAGGEHSHALHLWQLLARHSGIGEWQKVSAVMEMNQHDGAEYDSLASFSFVTDKGKVGRVIQDVVTLPIRKWARVQGDQGFIEWHCNGAPRGDLLRWQSKGGAVEERVFPKTRPDDFYLEMLHINDLLTGKAVPENSPISLEGAVSVMSVLASAYGQSNPLVEIEKL